MDKSYNILILGASYGSLLGTKLALAGHNVTLVCLPAEADLINAEGAIVRLPVRGRDGLVEVRSRDLPGKLSALGPADVNLADYDLVALAMQEPQYRSEGVRELLSAVAENRLPCMSIMNMPPLPYLKRIPGVDAEACRDCYTDPTVWDGFDPALVTLCSPDPQAFRPPDEPVNVLQVRLPTNFKSARFEADEHTAILRRTGEGSEPAAERIVRVADVDLDLGRRLVCVAGRNVSLTPTEFDLLASLARHDGAVRTRRQLLSDVWGYRDGSGHRTVDSHVRSLRRKLGDDVIRTVHGIGYASGTHAS